jgi:cyclopropane fatty-acyl-phospholipid synthase-like methyltransferase
MSILSKILRRFILPNHLAKVISLQRNRKKHQRVYDDAQLKLYAEILPGDFLHYGYFDNPDIEPREMSLNDISRAQQNYGLQLIQLIEDKKSPVLDIGCGMGGFIALMQKSGLNPTALTPDINQAKHIREKYHGVPLLEMKFEDLDAVQYNNYFGTVITSESLQYLKLDFSIPLIDKILMKEGKWIACDYFKHSEKGEKSGHNWEYFLQSLSEYGFKISYQRDITQNVLPTIAYAQMWATEIGMPLKDFILGKVAVKAPGIFYALEDALPEVEAKIQKNIETITPEIFAANKRYVLMVIERV